MSAAFDPGPAARLIANAYNTRTLLREVPEAARPKDLSDGYSVQDRIAADTLAGHGLDDSLAGWKLGFGSANAMKGASLARPVVGRLFGSRLYKAGDSVPVPGNSPALIEIEIAFRIARDIAPGETVARPLDVVSGANLVSEIVFSRFLDRKTVGLASFAADSVGFHALVVGQAVDASAIGAIARSVVASKDGAEVARAATGDDGIDPVAMLGHLMAHARERGLTLRKGDIVTTGTLSRPFEAASPARIAASADGAAIAYTMTLP
jgi:2-keto-4-pentenoate hydratase